MVQKITKSERHYRKIQDTVQDIYRVMYRAQEPMTRKQICEAIHRVRSPYLIKIIEKMVDHGWLTKKEYPLPNGMTNYQYTLAKKARNPQS